MARVEADVPKEWDKRLEAIKKERSIAKRQLVKDAIFYTYIKPESEDKNHPTEGTHTP